MDSGGKALVRSDLAADYSDRWFDPAYWRDQQKIVGEAFGRGTAYFVQSDSRHARTENWVLRHYRRGGLVGKLIRDSYLFTGEKAVRSLSEFQLLSQVAADGLPVPAPVAARYTRRGLWYTADILTQFLVHDITLAGLIKRPLPDWDEEAMLWKHVGSAIRSLHDAHIFHADLNAHNLLIRLQPSHSQPVAIIDFDRGRQMPSDGDQAWRDNNLRRLQRSVLKLSTASDQGRLAKAWEFLGAGYGAPVPQFPTSLSDQS